MRQDAFVGGVRGVMSLVDDHSPELSWQLRQPVLSGKGLDAADNDRRKHVIS